MAKTIVGQLNSKMQSKAIQIIDNDPTLTLTVDKRRLGQVIRKSLLVLVAVTISIVLLTTYITESPLFAPLCKTWVIIALLGFSALHSKS